jgi:hypothetical protein
VISIAEAQKADMIVRGPDAWGESAFARRVNIDDPALVIAKLEFSDGGRSSRQLDDCRVIVRTRHDLDWEYLESYAEGLGLRSLLAAVR